MPLPALNESTRFRYFTFFYLYAMQGIPAGFALTTLANYLVGQGAAPNIVGSFVGIIGTPWILQFLWGPVIDRYQYSTMGRRKHWLVFMQWGALLTLLFLLFITDPVKQVTTIAAIFFVHSIFASFQKTIITRCTALSRTLAGTRRRNPMAIKKIPGGTTALKTGVTIIQKTSKHNGAEPFI